MNPARLPVLILVNPTAGGGRARRLVPNVVRALQACGYPIEQFESQAAGEITARVRAVRTAHAALLVIGGDGTVREALAGDPAGTIPLAVLPCGSANVLGTELALPRQPVDVVRLIADGHCARFDTGVLRYVGGPRSAATGQANSAGFLLMVGTGIDGRVVHRVHRRRQGGTLGKPKYVGPVVAELMGFQPVRHWVTLEGGIRHGPFAQVLVTNVSSYGAFWQLPGNVDMQDGVLDVLGFRAGGRCGLLRHILRGSINLLRIGRELYHAQVRHVRVDADQESLVQADGEPAGCCPVEVEANPASVQLFCPVKTASRD